MEKCDGCPIKEKVALYKEAGKDGNLALKLGQEQRIGNDIDGLMVHFDRTADTILIGCRTKILCRVNARLVA